MGAWRPPSRALSPVGRQLPSRSPAEGRSARLGAHGHAATRRGAHGAVDTNSPVYAEREAAVKLSRGVVSLCSRTCACSTACTFRSAYSLAILLKRARLLSVPNTANAGASMHGLIWLELRVYINQRFTKALSIVRIRSRLYVDALTVSVCAHDSYAGVHSRAPGLVSRLVSMPIFEVLRLIPVSTMIITLNG